MSREYDQITAFHYSAFRPSLHSEILNEYFWEPGTRCFGLDIGCGTGHSSIALSNYCEKVIGIDPSIEMLNKSLKHPRVEYLLCDDKYLDFENDYFDTITFGGSLYYAKSQQLLNETVRVSKQNAELFVYDFELLLDEILNRLDIKSFSKQNSEYNHHENFSGLNQKGLKMEKELKKSFSINMSIPNLAHLLLSSKDNYGILVEFLGSDNLYSKLSQKLHSVIKVEEITVEAMTYLTLYRVSK